MPKYDVVVVGGGPVGATAALTLAIKSRGGLKIALIDSATPRRPSRVRTSALAPGPYAMLLDLAGDGLEAYQTPIRAMEISTKRWRAPAPPDLAFSSGDWLAAVVSHADLEPFLNSAALRSGVECIRGEAVGFQTNGVGAHLFLADGAVLETSLIVAADGDDSRLRTAAGISSIERDYRRTALVATLRHEEEHQGVALQIFYEPGPFALLPLGEKKSSMVWVETTEIARSLRSKSPEELQLLIQERSRNRFGAVCAIEDGPYAFPLTSRHAKAFAAERILLAGDALRRIHPLAGQGLNLGLRDAAAVARCVIDCAVIGLDPGGHEVAREYTQFRSADSVFNSVFLDLFFDVFDMNAPGFDFARTTALRATDHIPALKRFLSAEAGGLQGEHSFI